MSTPCAELKRRRAILSRHLGYNLSIKREYLKPQDQLRGLIGRLVDVRRTKVTLDFGEPGNGMWDVPIVQILLPDSIEPSPGQRALFA